MPNNPVRCDFSNRELYNPVYIPLFKDRSEFLHLFGSAGSGKSRFAAQRELVLSFDSSRRRRKTLVLRKIANTVKDSVYAELVQVVHEWNFTDHFKILKSPLSIVNRVTGVEFLFKGLDDPEKIKSVSRVDRVWIEEATELKSKAEIQQLRLRLRGFPNVQITLSYNPIDEFHWLNTEIHQKLPPGHRIFKTTYRDNEKLLAVDPGYGEYIESLKDSDSNYYRVYGLGEWGRVVEGLIYPAPRIVAEFPSLGEDANDEPIPDVHVYGLDFGYSDQTALVALNLTDALPKKVLTADLMLYETRLDADALIARLNALGVRRDVRIIADSARPEMIESIQKAGFRCEACEKWAGSVLSGINRVRNYDVAVTARSKELIKEFQNYQKKKLSNGQWLEEPEGNQVDHALDALRYGEQHFDGPDLNSLTVSTVDRESPYASFSV